MTLHINTSTAARQIRDTWVASGRYLATVKRNGIPITTTSPVITLQNGFNTNIGALAQGIGGVRIERAGVGNMAIDFEVPGT